jgi:hypothetical protein
MSTPAWILEIVGAAMLLIAELSAGQLLVTRAWTRRGGTDADIAVSQLLMGVAMASLLVPGLRTLPNAVWEVVFAVVTAWFAWSLWRERRGAAAAAGRHDAQRIVHSAAMLYLFAALPGPSVAESGAPASGTGGMSGMPGMASMSPGGTATLHASTLALVFVLLLIACTVRDLDRRARVDDYLPVVGRRLVPGGSALAAAAARPVALGQTAYADAEHLLLSPAVVKGCQVATGVAIAFILVIMILCIDMHPYH